MGTFRRVSLILTVVSLLVSGAGLMWTLHSMPKEIDSILGSGSSSPGQPAEAGPAMGEPPPGVGRPTSTRRPVHGDDPRKRPGSRPGNELRDRVAEAAYLARCAQAGNAQAAEEVKKRRETELDPRVRHALSSGEQVQVPRGPRWGPPPLPEPAKAAEPGDVDAYWLTPQRDGTYQSKVTIDAEGRAMVETIYEQADGDTWHVRYPGWAWRDANGNLVVDARDQEVDVIQHPPNGWWSPDSMVITPDGLIDLIDDKHDAGQGTTGAKGPG